MCVMEKQKKGWNKMAKTLIIIFLSLCCLSFVAYISLLIVGGLILLILKVGQLIEEWRNKHGKIL